MIPRPLSRRTFLRGAGVAMALPMLEGMLPARVLAGTAAAIAPRKRMIAICATLGLHAPYLVPEQAGAFTALTPYLAAMGDVAKSDVSVISGVSHPDVDGGHSAEASFLTAAPHPGSASFRNSISVDQYAAERLGAETRFASLALNTGGGGGSCSWTRNGVQIPGDGSPSKVFARLFLNGNAQQVQNQVNKLKEGQSVMDTVNADAKRMAAALGHADRDKLDEYFTSVRELEQRMVKAEEWSKKPKPKVDVPQPKDITDRADLIGCTRLMYDLMHLAIQTDSSRIFTLQVQGTGFVVPVEGVTEAHHSLSHHGKDPKKLEQLKAVESAEMKVFGEFLAKLKNTKEEGSNLLDQTMLMYSSNMSNASSHDNKNLPVIFAGGGFKHGRHLQFDPQSNAPLCNLFVSMLQKMGVDADRFATSRGTLRGLA